MISGDWVALGAAVREWRHALGYSTQDAAALACGVSKSTWQRLEGGAPIGATSLNRVARLFGWDTSTAASILRGVADPPALVGRPRQPIASSDECGPGLLFVASDGTRCEIDRDVWDPLSLPARDRALCRALLLHSLERLDAVDVARNPSSRPQPVHPAVDGPVSAVHRTDREETP